MLILGIGKKIKEDLKEIQHYLIDVTEDEADMITGVAGKTHIQGTDKEGVRVNIASIYDKVKRINERHAEIKAAAVELQADAADLENAIPLT